MIKRVWVEPGCVVCNACETACPEVFHVTSKTSIVLKGVRFEPYVSQIEEAAAICPTQVIKYESTRKKG